MAIAISYHDVDEPNVATSVENQATTLNKANEAWKKVKGTPEVSKYKEQADNKNRMEAEAEGTTIRQEHKKVMARNILTEIKKMCFQLEELDYEAMFVAIDTEQSLHNSGTTEGQKFLDKEVELLRKFGLSVIGGNADGPVKKQSVQHYVPACRSSLTKNTATLHSVWYDIEALPQFRFLPCEKYQHFRCRTGRRAMSYKQLAMGNIVVDGLPPGITCKRPSAYGVDDLQAILHSKNSITIRSSSNATITPDANCPSAMNMTRIKTKALDRDEAVHPSYDQELLSFLNVNADFFPVEKVLKKRQKKGETQYLVKWQGYSSKYNQWVDAGSISKEALDMYKGI
ncbi:chromatin modulator polycomb protein [Apostichopus japonicus]|uniref:Chromatin modulator polycomb protein n=1 Tax=Stichopus japonicus TaxID=307972 RepID=A0A2G8LJB0_STIJA|nr:chromatin modulator polycomb protein [Apostichopus japonicus]